MVWPSNSLSRLFIAGMTLFLAANICAACSKPKAAATCKPSGTALSISASGVKFDKNCLAAPANESFTIAFTNRGPLFAHNVAIYTDPSASKSLFVGSTITAGSTVYRLTGLPAGTYYFRCDHHPAMSGTFVVR
jgi:plastocyanin